MKRRAITLALILVAVAILFRVPSFAAKYQKLLGDAGGGNVSKTQASLQRWGHSPAVPAQAGAGPNEHNVDLLARLIRAEAEAEPYEGKVAVAAVMLNRTRDSRFPNTLEGVVFEVDAFESVSNGRIYETPPTDEDYRAARDALNGWDPTWGCVFFWNPATATSPWVWSRPVLTQIGSHVFAK